MNAENDQTKPKRRNEPTPIVEGWAMDLYCQYTVDVSHDMDTHGVSIGGVDRADARRQARAMGWVLHHDGFATCPRCARRIRGAMG